MLKIKDPLDIDLEINEQRKKCDALLEQKNKLIEDLKHELKRTDDAYYDDLDKQVRITLIGSFHCQNTGTKIYRYLIYSS